MAALAALVAVLAPAGPAAARQAVDVELLLAIDVSNSIAPEERTLQLAGIAGAFRDPRVLDAIRALDGGRIAVAVMAWSGEDEQALVIPWHLARDRPSADGLAAAVEKGTQLPWSGVTYTAIGDALLAARSYINESDFDGRRRVIDLSADDRSNQGFDTARARDFVAGAGFVINGIPMLTGRADHEEREELVRYFRDNVVGGLHAFVIPALSYGDLKRVMLAKLIREISGLPDAPQRRFASAGSMRIWQRPKSDSEITLRRAGSRQ